jgi:hypothetical protein
LNQDTCFHETGVICEALARVRQASVSGQSGQRRAFAQDGPIRCEGGGPGGVSDLGGDGAAHRGSERRVDLRAALGQDADCRPLRSQDPRCPMEQKRLKDTPGLTLGRVSGVPPRGLEMCLAQADSTPMAPFSRIAAVERQHAVADRREPRSRANTLMSQWMLP